MQNYNALVEYGLGKHKEEIEPERVEIPLLYFGSVIASMCNLRIYNIEEDEVETPNFYGMTFLPSGYGKDFARSIYHKLFNEIICYMPLMIESFCAGFDPKGNRITRFPSKYDKKIHKEYRVSIGSSDIGIYIQALAVKCADFGSLNVEINEFADHLGKSENINMLKELYDGELKAKLIQGNDDDEARQGISGICCNALIYGSPMPIKEDRRRMQQFKELTTSGMYRRSIVYFSEPRVTKKKEQNKVDVSHILQGIKDRLKQFVVSSKGGFSKLDDWTFIDKTDEAESRLSEIRQYLFDQSNKKIYDELTAIDKYSHKLIEKVATIVAFLDLSERVEVEHIDYAFDLFKRTRQTVYELLEDTPLFEKIYKLLSMSTEPIPQTFIMKRLAVGSSKEFLDALPLTSEFAYRNNKTLEERGVNIKNFILRDLPKTNLSKIKVSIGIDNKMEQSINFRATEIPFFGERFSIEELVKSSEFQCFCTAHFKGTKKAEHGHRAEENFIEGQNLIAFDFDSGLTIDEVRAKFEGLVYMIYTTKSHNKDGKGERFRLLLPTEYEFFVTPEQHKQMYENIANAFDVVAYDKATRNVSRLWFTNQEAIIIKSENGDLLDVRRFLPETTTSKKFEKTMKVITADEKDIRVQGFLKWFFASTATGSRNVNLYKFKKFLDYLGVPARPKIEKYNAMLDEPLPDKEIRVILRGS